MIYSFDGYNYVIRLDKGERLQAAIIQFATKTQLQGAWLSGLGGALEVELGYYNLDTKAYQWQVFTGLREVTNLTGNLALEVTGEPIAHLHGTFADEHYHTIGGHVKDLVAGATLELFVHATYQLLYRKLDPAIGLPTLDFPRKGLTGRI